MNILDSKYIPLKVFIGRRKKELRFAWHWRWSITWRWIVTWSICRSVWAVRKHSTENGHFWINICMGRLGVIRFTSQPNMLRAEG